MCVLLCSPRAAGLFQRAVVESGPCVGPWAPGNTTFAAEAAASVLAQAGVASFHDLQRVPAVDIFWPNAIANNLLFPGAFLDGKGGVMPEVQRDRDTRCYVGCDKMGDTTLRATASGVLAEVGF